MSIREQGRNVPHKQANQQVSEPATEQTPTLTST